MFNKVYSKSPSNLKNIKFSELVCVLQHVSQLSLIKRNEKSSSYDFDRSLPYLKENGLQNHICSISRNFKELPLNSERHLYDMNNIIIRHLYIKLDDQFAWKAYDDWEPISSAKWHFEDCEFFASSPNMWTLLIPWRGSFRFYRNEFSFKNKESGGNWLFAFQNGSRILFQGNKFRKSSVQTTCRQGETRDTPSNFRNMGIISFVGNREILSLGFQEGFSTVSLTGMNHIERLIFFSFSDSTQVSDAELDQEPMVYLGPREKIDRYFHYCLQHREMFLHLRKMAAQNHDERQTRVLDKQIDRIEYYLNKEQDLPCLLDFRIWIEYWQDRLLYAWRRISSDFYKSWIRPLSMIILGYMLMNALPFIALDTFTYLHWFELTLRPIGEVANYEQSLSRIVGAEYVNASPFSKILFKLIGLLEVVWIAMWSFAFARSIRK